ncbi:hypothetical protein AB0D38_16020 [Streptomyces sp. NPDC048279]|uniref:hypothetical protein n=1 Tax=Streptomyces sp. NPDC048279 TaxID=3154714 RepID=UPI0034474704
MSKQTLLGMAGLCVAAAVALTACGGGTGSGPQKAGTAVSATPSPSKPFEGQSAAQIAAKSRVTMRNLKSFKAKGTLTSEGRRMTVDMVFAGKGNCLGTFGFQSGTGQIRWYGGDTYMKGDKKFWQLLAGDQKGVSPQKAGAISELLSGRWLKMPAGSMDTDENLPSCDAAAIFTKDSPDSSLARGADTSVNGRRAVTLTGKDGAATHTLVVAAEGEPYQLRMTTKGGGEPETLELSAFNKPVTLTPLSADDVLDLGKLQH